MSKWAGKYVIGLTGNIGTGKSVVRRMLEHLGAYGIDADALAHRAIARGAPGFQPAVDLFGNWVLGTDGQIDRARLGRLVFGDPQALARLEAIVHPLVNQAVEVMARRATQNVIVIEAIKLLESNLRQTLDSVWVTYTSPAVQLTRLVKNRPMSEVEARQRIEAQPPQETRFAAAQVVIKNEVSFEDTWRQVVAAWQTITIPNIAQSQLAEPQTLVLKTADMTVLHGKPRHSSEIATLLNRLQQSTRALTAADIMAAFGEKAFLMIQMQNKLVGLMGWQVENLIARTEGIVLDPAVQPEKALPVLFEEMERESRNLQCEASLVSAPKTLNVPVDFWQQQGYNPCTPQSLDVQAWQEAAKELLTANTMLYFKPLRQDRIMRPV